LYTGIAPATFDVTKKNMIKEQIINTAFDLFSQYGIKSVRTDDVEKAAGISKRTLYESFEDKETLLIEGIDHNTESLGQYLTGLEKEPFNALEVILLFYEEMMKNPRWFNEKFYEDLMEYLQKTLEGRNIFVCSFTSKAMISKLIPFWNTPSLTPRVNKSIHLLPNT